MKKTIDYFPEGANTLSTFQSAKKRYEVLLKNFGAGKSSFQDIPLRAPFLHPNVVVSAKCLHPNLVEPPLSPIFSIVEFES